ncbi:hypothetical protein GCM10018954_090070 [Kutzneria kofuensis]
MRPALTRAQYKPPEANLGAVQPCSEGVKAAESTWTGLVAVNLKKILIWAGVALVLFFLVSAPAQAATLVHNVLGTLRGGAEALISFVQNLF